MVFPRRACVGEELLDEVVEVCRRRRRSGDLPLRISCSRSAAVASEPARASPVGGVSPGGGGAGLPRAPALAWGARQGAVLPRAGARAFDAVFTFMSSCCRCFFWAFLSFLFFLSWRCCFRIVMTALAMLVASSMFVAVAPSGGATAASGADASPACCCGCRGMLPVVVVVFVAEGGVGRRGRGRGRCCGCGVGKDVSHPRRRCRRRRGRGGPPMARRC